MRKYLMLLFVIIVLPNRFYCLASDISIRIKEETTQKTDCTIDKVERIIRQLPEVIAADTRIRVLTNNMHGISLITDTDTIEDNLYFTFQLGYNGKERFESYFFFYVNRIDYSDIRVLDVINGDIIPIDDWRKRQTY